MKASALIPPESPSANRYFGPGWHEWLFGFASAVVLALELSELLKSRRTQTAESYYFQTPGVLLTHGAAIGLVFLILITLSVWIAFPKFANKLRLIVMTLAVIGFGLVWFELARASVIQDPRFVLSGLPFEPINNMGVVGATVFGGYVMLKMPNGLLKPMVSTLIKASFIVSLLIVQLMMFEQFARGGL